MNAETATSRSDKEEAALRIAVQYARTYLDDEGEYELMPYLNTEIVRLCLYHMDQFVESICDAMNIYPTRDGAPDRRYKWINFSAAWEQCKDSEYDTFIPIILIQTYNPSQNQNEWAAQPDRDYHPDNEWPRECSDYDDDQQWYVSATDLINRLQDARDEHPLSADEVAAHLHYCCRPDRPSVTG